MTDQKLVLGTGNRPKHDFQRLVLSPQRGRCLFLLHALFLYLASNQHWIQSVNTPSCWEADVGFFWWQLALPDKGTPPCPGDVTTERWLPKEARLATRTDVPRAPSGCSTRGPQGVLHLVTTRAQLWADTEVAAPS